MTTQPGPPLREGSGILLVDWRGRILLQQRDDHVPPEGYGRWAIPGGGREGDEEPLATALREFEEETGIRLQQLRHYASFGPIAGLRLRALHLFSANDAVDEDAIEVNEGIDFRFWSPAEIATLRMNPVTRRLVDDFLASGHYRDAATGQSSVAVIEIDRWGRFLLQRTGRRQAASGPSAEWDLPGGAVGPGEPPDAAALREFEAQTGYGLESLRHYRSFAGSEVEAGPAVLRLHVYYADADLEAGTVDAPGEAPHAYFATGDLGALNLAPAARAVLEKFAESPAYRALFH